MYDAAGRTISNNGPYIPWPLAKVSGVSSDLFGFFASSTISSRSNKISRDDLQWLTAAVKCNGVWSENKEIIYVVLVVRDWHT